MSARKKNIFDLIDEIRSIAQTGLNYCDNPYDRQRYERLLQISSSEYEALSGVPEGEIKTRFGEEIGYITPKVGIQGAIVNALGEILLERRIDDGKWGLPAGWMDVGESPAQFIEREIFEETNLVVVPEKVIGFYNRLAGDYQQPHASVHILFWCRLIGGELKKSFESLDVRFCNISTIREWHANHGTLAHDAIQYWKLLTAI